MIKKPTIAPKKAPSAPSKPNAPQRPGKPVKAPDMTEALAASVEATAPAKRGPGRPPGSKNRPKDAPEHETEAAAPMAPMLPNGKSATVPRDVAEAEFRKLRDAFQASEQRIKELTETVSKLRAKPRNVRTISEITENPPALAKADWRVKGQYHGAEITVYACGVNKAGDDSSFFVDQSRTVPVLLAIPRDNDIGGLGTEARAEGRLAVHWARSEDGESFTGQPMYLLESQLAECWAE